MKFLIIGDLHGKKPHIQFTQYDAVLATGDFCSDSIKPLVFQALQYRCDHPDSNIQWYDLLSEQRAQQEREQSLADGRTVLKSLHALNKPVFLVPGNWDWVDEGRFSSLLDGLDNLTNLHLSSQSFQDLQLIGYGLRSHPEFLQGDPLLGSPDQKNNYEKTKQALLPLCKKPSLFLTHNMPYNTPFDLVDTGPRSGRHVGSVVVRELIDKFHPLVSVGGHMHQFFGSFTLDSTVVVSAGFGPKKNTLLEIQDNQIVKLEQKG